MDSRLLTDWGGVFAVPMWFRLGHRSFAWYQDDKLGDSCPLPYSLQVQAPAAGMPVNEQL